MFHLWSKRPDRILIEEASEDDLSDCAEIHHGSFSQGWDAHVLVQMARAKGAHCLVAKTEGNRHKLTGFLLYRISAKEAEILTVAVDPDSRRSGTSTALLEEMIRHCLTERLEEIFLEVDETNMGAVNLYKRLGFAKVGERKGYYASANAKAGETTAAKSAGMMMEASSGNALIMRLDLLA